VNNQPEHVKCIAHTHADLIGLSWCGKRVSHEWRFVNIDHAVYNALHEGRLLACAECIEAIFDAFRPQELEDT
jgi:hypothetical protein